MTKTPNKSEAYRNLLHMFRQTYGNAQVLAVASYDDKDLILTILGTDAKMVFKNLPVDGIAQGDLLYVDGDGDWTNLGAGEKGQPLTTQGEDADPKWDDEIVLKPKASSSSTVEGTIFYCTDKYVYVATE